MVAVTYVSDRGLAVAAPGAGFAALTADTGDAPMCAEAAAGVGLATATPAVGAAGAAESTGTAAAVAPAESTPDGKMPAPYGEKTKNVTS